MVDTNANEDIFWVEQQRAGAPAFDLDTALRSNSIEFWYQPKIDLRQKKLVGVEAFARFTAPDGRVVSAGELIKRASSDGVVKLTERALISALQTSVNLCEMGVDTRLAINVSVAALQKIPIVDIVRTYRPQGGKCLSLVFDISEREVLERVDDIAKVASHIRRCGFSVAVDDFGSSVLDAIGRHAEWGATIDRTFEAIARLRTIEFLELKLDRDLVRGCGADDSRKTVCKHIVGLAHSLGSLAVGVGIEQQSELKALQDMNCDIGQGYLFGRPMSEERFLMLLWDRGVRGNTKKRPAPAAA